MALLEAPRGSATYLNSARVSRRGPLRPMSGHDSGRSRRFPEGKPGVEGHNASRIRSANSIFHNMMAFVAKCIDARVPVVFGTVARSFFLKTRAYRARRNKPEVFEIVVDMCHFGSSSKSAHRFLTNIAALSELRATCSGDHDHGPVRVGVFDYPDEFKKKLLNALVGIEGLVTKRTETELHRSTEESTKQELAKVRAAAGRQPRGARYL